MTQYKSPNKLQLLSTECSALYARYLQALGNTRNVDALAGLGTTRDVDIVPFPVAARLSAAASNDDTIAPGLDGAIT